MPLPTDVAQLEAIVLLLDKFELADEVRIQLAPFFEDEHLLKFVPQLFSDDPVPMEASHSRPVEVGALFGCASSLGIRLHEQVLVCVYGSYGEVSECVPYADVGAWVKVEDARMTAISRVLSTAEGASAARKLERMQTEMLRRLEGLGCTSVSAMWDEGSLRGGAA